MQAHRDREAAMIRAAHTKAIAAQLGVRYAPDRVGLDRFVIKHPGQRQVLDRIRTFAARLPEAIKAGENLILFGSPGTGKDHIVSSLLHHVAATVVFGDVDRFERSIPVACFASGLQLFDVFHRRSTGHSTGRDSEFLKDAAGCAVLAISDPLPPASSPSDFALNQLHGLVDQRYRNLRPVWMTMNVRDEAEAKDMLRVPLWDRLVDNAHLIPCFWPSWRKCAD